MNRRFAWSGAFVGGVLMFRWLKRGSRRPEAAPEGDGDPAAALRAKLEESRAGVPEPEPAVEEPADPPADPEARRRAVHEQARARLDDLKPKP